MGFNIGNIVIKNKIVIAPMAGISNYAYLKICEEMGAGYAYTELISAEGIIRNNKKTLEMLKGIEKLSIPIAIQLFGGNISSVVKAAKIISNLYPNCIIDLNMGCPVPKVAIHSKAGSALLKDIDKIYEMTSQVVKAVKNPVTVKIRSGWDDNSINAIDVAKIIEKAGAKAICIHPRTRKQLFSGEANWDIIKQIKSSVSIPVIGNGDVKTVEDFQKMLNETNCDAVMIGRGVLGNPWLIKNINNYINKDKEIVPSIIEKIDICLKHLEYLREIKIEKLVALEIRNHISWYLKGLKDINGLKNKIYQTKDVCDIILLLNNVKEEYYEK